VRKGREGGDAREEGERREKRGEGEKRKKKTHGLEFSNGQKMILESFLEYLRGTTQRQVAGFKLQLQLRYVSEIGEEEEDDNRKRVVEGEGRGNKREDGEEDENEEKGREDE
jgi:hypothetical protein